MAWTRHPNAYQEPPLRANRRTLHGKAAGQGIIVTPISLKSAVLGGVVAAYVEGQEIEPLLKVDDPCLVLVEGQPSWLQPGAQLLPDRLGLLAAVAQGHEIIRIGHDDWGAGFSVTVLV